MLPLSIANSLFFLEVHKIAAYFFFLVFPSLRSFLLTFIQQRVVLHKTVPTQNVDKPAGLPCF